MKIIKYRFITEVNYGTDELPDIRQIFTNASVPYSEANMEFAKAEAYNGEVTVEDSDSGMYYAPTMTPQPTNSDRLSALESAMLAMMGGMSNV